MAEESIALEEKKIFTPEVPDILLFVCTGNTCRSPMAAAMFNFLFPERNAFAVSAGLCADGSPISEMRRRHCGGAEFPALSKTTIQITSRAR